MLKIFFIFLSIHLFTDAHTVRETVALFDPLEQKPFVIVVTSYNNHEWYERNLASIIDQEYDNFRLIYIDDCSTDDTAFLVEKYLQEHRFQRYTLIKNSVWQSQMANHYKAVYLCDDGEIIVHIDGDDWFDNLYVLQLLNKVYSYDDIWLTYGQYQAWPDGGAGGSHEVPQWVIEANAFRESDFCYSHPRSFYAWLFKKIKLKDLIYKGSFIPAATAPDLAFMFAMVEMAGTHIQFIPDILYQYNRANSLSQHNIPVTKEYPPVQTWPKYTPLTHADSRVSTNWAHKKIAVVIIDDGENDLFDMLAQDTIKEIDVFILSLFNNPVYYAALKELFPTIKMVNAWSGDLRELKAYDYALLITDAKKELKDTDIKSGIQALEQTQAYAFFLNINKNNFIPCNESINYAPFNPAIIEYRYVPVSENILAWQGDYEDYLWHTASLYHQLILPMQTVLAVINKSNQQNFNNNLRDYIYDQMHQDRQIGLLFAQ